MSDLADFLLARIAEDEAVAEEWPEALIERPAGGVMMDTHGHPIYAPRSKVLAECQAKREIVQLYLAAVDESEQIVFGGDDGIGMLKKLGAASKAEGCKEAMRSISLVYRDHPQYDPIWTLA